jgi:crossover junction endodeoxyribonuclease RuvC
MEDTGGSGARSGNGLPPHVPDGVAWPIVLGIDPGTRLLGYGALVAGRDAPRFLAAGVLRVPAGLSTPARLAWIRTLVEDLVQRLRPAAIVVEQAFTARYVQSALRIGEARGVVLAVAGASGAEVVQIAPAAAKKAVVGNGAAAKEQVAEMVRRALLVPQPLASLDASDALALALAHVRRSRASTIVGSIAPAAGLRGRGLGRGRGRTRPAGPAAAGGSAAV